MKQSFCITTATSTARNTLAALREATANARAALGGAAPDAAFVFLAGHDATAIEAAAPVLAGELEARALAGCTVEATIGGAVEYEGEPAVTLWAGLLPGARFTPARLELAESDEGYAFTGMPAVTREKERGEEDAASPTMILLGDPFSFPADAFLKRAGEDFPGLRVMGGMASGAHRPGENRLLLASAGADLEVFAEGAAAILFDDGVSIEPVVSQGCKPFGRPLVVTRAEENVILEIGGQPALEKLKEQLAELQPEERALIARGLHLGIAIDARKREHRRGDFLVRNLLGVHRERHGLVVADHVRPGQTVQFHLRDASSASEDLHLLLRASRGGWPAGAGPAGGLLFSCNGRGQRLFEAPNHDAQAVQDELGEVHLAGFFAAGEVGPVGGRNFLHGFTASLALFHPI
jgi:small ligand-binding sensory domain FIST